MPKTKQQVKKDVSWIRPGITVRIGAYVDPGSTLTFSKSGGACGSIMSIDGDYAEVYISDNRTRGLPPQERVPLIQCEKLS